MVSLKEEDAGAEQPLVSSGELNEVVVHPQVRYVFVCSVRV